MSGKGVNTADFLFDWKRVYQGGAKRLAFFFSGIIQRAFGLAAVILSFLNTSSFIRSCTVSLGIECLDYHVCTAQIGAQPHSLARQNRNAKHA